MNREAAREKSVRHGYGSTLHLCSPRPLNRNNLLDRLTQLSTNRGVPDYLRPDSGRELTANAVGKCPRCLSVEMLFIEPGSPYLRPQRSPRA